ncbi:MAG: glycosyltransferase [Bacteroidota bacterium]|nr:glycosyltransferase [Bacteroidota bacterium]
MISIILPIYNGEKTLLNTLKSLQNQTVQKFELIACIDGTNDGSEQILRDQNDVKIKIIKNKQNLGLGRTLNRLISHCSPETEYIAIAEQDDYYIPERLALQMDVLDTHPKVGLVTGVAEHYDGKNSTYFPGLLAKGNSYPTDPIEMLKLNFREQIKVVQTCMMFRKSVHQDNGLYFT